MVPATNSNSATSEGKQHELSVFMCILFMEKIENISFIIFAHFCFIVFAHFCKTCCAIARHTKAASITDGFHYLQEARL